MFSSSYIIKAIDQFSPIASKVSQGFDKISSKASKAKQATTGFSKALNTMSALKALATGAVAHYSFTTLVNFSEQMQGVKAVATETGVSFKKLEEQAKELGRTTRYTASDAAAAQYFLAKAGYDTQKIYDSMPATLTLAASANLDIAQSADIVTNIMSGYAMESNELAGAVDVLTKAFTSSNTDLVDLGTAMKYAGPVAKGMGIDFAEAAAAIGMMGNAGIQGSMAGTSLRGALVRLAKPTKEVRRYIKGLKLDIYNADGSIKSLTDIVEQLEKRGATTAHMMAIFGQRAGPAMSALVSQGSDKLKEFNQTLVNSQGAAQRTADIQMEGLYGTWIKLKSATEGLVHSIGDAGLTNVLKGLGDALIFVINAFSGFLNNVKAGAEWLGGGFGETLVDIYFGVKHLYEAFSEWLSSKLVDTVVYLTDKFKSFYDLIIKIIDKIKSWDIVQKATEQFNKFKGWFNDTVSLNPEINETRVQEIQNGINESSPLKNEIDLNITVSDKNQIVGNIQSSVKGSSDLSMDVGRSSMGL